MLGLAWRAHALDEPRCPTECRMAQFDLLLSLHDDLIREADAQVVDPLMEPIGHQLTEVEVDDACGREDQPAPWRYPCLHSEEPELDAATPVNNESRRCPLKCTPNRENLAETAEYG
jgi:hypothetical protein